MIKVEVCSHCKTQTCGIDKGINIYEEFKIYEELLKEKSIEFEVKECRCLGKCRGPVVKVNGKVYTQTNAEKVEEILNWLIWKEESNIVENMG
ncbi:(2Fe-2S) ferredoxin domain-containing protein [Sporosalibacterium faouarense]|uniref:(2Fe-2S) ferredoxin domain-containing protein n=1 Tax=Sporosalibacterium faouarense TaxID=516123 RepID=UPI00192BE322|nr:(2Fe-2S) ferredoxin domain-containing protein [Sporosalibacterium faouarense]